MANLPTNNLDYPVLIKIGNSSGSGFFIRTEQYIYLVTASHVIYDDGVLRDSIISLISYEDAFGAAKQHKLEIDLTKVKIETKPNVDIAVIEIAVRQADKSITLVNGVKKISKGGINIIVVPPDSLKKFADVQISNDVFIIGYPSSLGLTNQIEQEKPLLRKGIVAGKNQQKKTIILDCPVYFGNSGGLAIEVSEEMKNGLIQTRYRIIGVVSQFIAFVETLESKQLGYVNTNIENSGYSVVVPIDTIIEVAKKGE